MYSVLYHASVVREDIPKLSAPWKEKVKKAIEDKLITHPELYGKPLRQSLHGYRKLRVGDYRVIFKIKDDTVVAFLIAHRSIVYDIAYTRV